MTMIVTINIGEMMMIGGCSGDDGNDCENDTVGGEAVDVMTRVANTVKTIMSS